MLNAVWFPLGNAHDAEDALQDALVVIVRKWERVLKHPNPHALVLKICTETAVDHARSRKRRFRNRQKQLDAGQAELGTEVADIVANQELNDEIISIVARLPRNQAIAFLLRATQDQPYENIAAALGCRESTARKHVARARERLSVALRHLRER